MKYIIIFISILMFPITLNAYWLCPSADYLVIDYNDSKKTIKWWWIYDIFLLSPIKLLDTDNVTVLWSHSSNNFDSCKYKNFENLNKLYFKDLSIYDKVNLLSNIILFMIVSLWILYLSFKYIWNKWLFILALIVSWLILFSFIYVFLNK